MGRESGPQHLPAVDGLRAVSILLVIFSHVLQTYHWSQTVPFVWRLAPGATGVSVFFVISGYLITTLLLREQALKQRISLKGFYVRRFFCIVPAYLAYLLTVALLTFAGVLIRQFGWVLFWIRLIKRGNTDLFPLPCRTQSPSCPAQAHLKKPNPTQPNPTKPNKISQMRCPRDLNY